VGHAHGHGHAHGAPSGNSGSVSAAHRGRLRIALALSCTVLALEIAGGLLSHSLALLADAGHVATDAVGLALALFALRIAARPATLERTFGYYRVEILAAVGNAVLLFGVAAWVFYEAASRLGSPSHDVHSTLMLSVAAVALVANLIGVRLLSAGSKESLNVRGAYLEALGDLLGAIAVIVAGTLLAVFGWTWADPVASIAIGGMILPRTWSLLRDAMNVLLEAAPKGMDLAGVRQHILDRPGVLAVHDLHAWTITSGLPVLTAHVVVDDVTLDGTAIGPLLDQLHDCLRGHFDVEHSTFQLEPAGHAAHEEVCHS
jgi:cobalt-zinc-cadmium efflux system protein